LVLHIKRFTLKNWTPRKLSKREFLLLSIVFICYHHFFKVVQIDIPEDIIDLNSYQADKNLNEFYIPPQEIPNYGKDLILFSNLS
jgi:hypothetical protein